MNRYLSLFILALLFSCSTNKTSPPSPVTFNPPDVITIDSTMAPTARFDIDKSMVQYTPLALRAQKFFKLLETDNSLIPSQSFSSTLDDRNIVISKIKASEGEIVSLVKIYYPSMFQTNRVTAYREGNQILFNGNRMNRGDCPLINTFVHEYLHHLGYGHSSAKDYQSVPYYFGSMAEEACKKDLI